MSDTPRTDAEVFEVDVVFVSYDGPAFEPKNVVEPDFARELERENAALREEAKEQCTLNAKGSEREYSLRGRIEQLERDNAALRADAERYHYIRRDTARRVGILWDFIESVDFFDLDAAIDAARAKEAKP